MQDLVGRSDPESRLGVEVRCATSHPIPSVRCEGTSVPPHGDRRAGLAEARCYAKVARCYASQGVLESSVTQRSPKLTDAESFVTDGKSRRRSEFSAVASAPKTAPMWLPNMVDVSSSLHMHESIIK